MSLSKDSSKNNLNEGERYNAPKKIPFKKGDDDQYREEINTLFKQLFIAEKKRRARRERARTSARDLKNRIIPQCFTGYTPQGRLAIYGPDIDDPPPASLEGDQLLEELKAAEIVRQMFSGFKVGLDDESKELLSQAVDTVKDIRENGLKHDVSQDLKDLFSDGLDKIGSLKDANVNVNTSDITSLFERFAGKFSEFGVLIILIVMIVLYMPKENDKKVMFGVVIVSLLARYVVFADLIAIVSSYFQKAQQVEAQFDVASSTNLATLITGLLNTYLFASLGKDIFKGPDLVKVLGAMSRSGSSVKSITDCMYMMAEYTRGTIESWFSTPGDSTFVRSGYSFIDEWLKEADAIRKGNDDKSLLGTRATIDRIRACIKQGEAHVRNLHGQEYNSLRMLMLSILQKLEKVKDKILMTNFAYAGVRMEPVCILLRGSPGCGKSLAMQHIADALMSLVLSPAEFEQYKQNREVFIYNRQAETIYWQGYTQMKRIVFFDDFGQIRDMKGVPDGEIMNLIRAVNVFENMLHMADMDSKGNTLFRADWVIANTNIESFMLIESIHDVNALIRRFDVPVKVCPRAEFCEEPLPPDIWNRKIDINKLPIVDGVTFMHPDQLEFHLEKRGDKKLVMSDRTMNFEEFIAYCYEKYKIKIARHEQYTKTLDETMIKYRKMYEAAHEKYEAQMFKSSTTVNRSKFNELFIKKIAEGLKTKSAFEIQMEDLFNDKPGLYRLGEKIIPIIIMRLATDMGIGLSLEEAWTFYHEETDNIPDISFEELLPSINEFQETLFVAFVEKVSLNKVVDEDWEGAVVNVRNWWQKAADVLGTPPEWQNRIMQCYNFCIALLADSPLKDISDRFRVFGLNLWSSGSSLLNMPREVLIKRAAALGGFLVFVRLLMSIWPMVFPTEEKIPQMEVIPDVESQGYYHHYGIEAAVRMAKSHRHKNPNPRYLPQGGEVKTSIVAQGYMDSNENFKNLVEFVIKKNVFAFVRPLPDYDRKPGSTHSRAGFALGIVDRLVICPYHFMMLIEHNLENGFYKDDDIVAFDPIVPGRKMFQISVLELMQCWYDSRIAQESEFAVLVLPKRFQPVADITKKFATEKMIEQYDKLDCNLIIPPKPNTLTKEFHGFRAWRDDAGQHVPEDIQKNGVMPAYHIRRTYCYRASTSPGDCGGILFADDRRTSFPIIGLHVAGSESAHLGVSSIITRELISEFLKTTGDYKPIIMSEDIPDTTFSPQGSRNVVVVGEMNCSLPSGSGKSRIKRSPLYSRFGFPAKKAPAKLRLWTDESGIVHNVLDDALSTYCLNDSYIPTEYLVAARKSLQDWINSQGKNKDSKKKMFTFEEAVLGDGSDWFTSIDRTKSAGYPWSSMPGVHTKERFFLTKEVYDLDNEECHLLKERILSRLDDARNGIRNLFLYTDCAKDELRSLEKVKKGDTRLFSACPVDLLILFRMLFGAFAKFILMNALSLGVIVGISEYSADWDMLARDLLKFKTDFNIGAGDFKGFDKNELSSINWEILEIINEWYGNEDGNNLARRVLWEEICNSQHIFDGKWMSWLNSLPSGNPLTILINCLHVLFVLRLAWIAICGLKLLPRFNTDVNPKATGDDHLFAVTPPFKELFTERNIAEALIRIGYKYVPEDKSLTEFGDGLRNLTDVTYLKRKFVYDSSLSRWVAPLDLFTILEIPYWVRDGATSYSDVMINVRIALEELSLHSKVVYTTWKNKIEQAVYAVDGIEMPDCTHYEMIRAKVLERGTTDLSWLTEVHTTAQEGNIFVDLEDALTVEEEEDIMTLFEGQSLEAQAGNDVELLNTMLNDLNLLRDDIDAERAEAFLMVEGTGLFRIFAAADDEVYHALIEGGISVILQNDLSQREFEKIVTRKRKELFKLMDTLWGYDEDGEPLDPIEYVILALKTILDEEIVKMRNEDLDDVRNECKSLRFSAQAGNDVCTLPVEEEEIYIAPLDDLDDSNLVVTRTDEQPVDPDFFRQPLIMPTIKLIRDFGTQQQQLDRMHESIERYREVLRKAGELSGADMSNSDYCRRVAGYLFSALEEAPPASYEREWIIEALKDLGVSAQSGNDEAFELDSFDSDFDDYDETLRVEQEKQKRYETLMGLIVRYPVKTSTMSWKEFGQRKCQVLLAELMLYGDYTFDQIKFLEDLMGLLDNLRGTTEQSILDDDDLLVEQTGVPNQVVREVYRTLFNIPDKYVEKKTENYKPSPSRLRKLDNTLEKRKVKSARKVLEQPVFQPLEAVGAFLSNFRISLLVGFLVLGLLVSRTAAMETTTSIHDSQPVALDSGSAYVQARAMGTEETFGATTNMTNDGETAKGFPLMYTSLDSTVLEGPNTHVSQEIKDFLRKPVEIQNNNFATTDTPLLAVSTTPLIPFDVMYGFNSIAIHKLEGNMAFRGTLHVTVVINANRFQQGRYILLWNPDGGGDFSANAVSVLLSRVATLTQMTQLPHVEIDLNCDTEVSLVIPCINAVGWYNLYSGGTRMFGNGLFGLYCYSPLVTAGGSTTAAWTMYTHWEDIEYVLPIIPHSGRNNVRGRVRRRAFQEEEQGSGIVSGMASAISTASQAFAGVPLLSSIAGQVGWVSDIVGKVASAFGWSKFHQNSVAGLMSRWILFRYGNADTPDNGTKLALLDKATLEELPAFAGSQVDEMSMNFVSSIPAYYLNLTWPETSPSGTLLWGQLVTPRDFTYTNTLGGVNFWNPTPLAFVSNFFNLWRGSIKFTFKIIKTEFHSGRLLVAFLPFEYGITGTNPTNPSLTDTVFLHREIIDIRKGNEFTITIPYASMVSYRPIFGPDRATGTLYVFILNPLVAPSTVANAVQILVEVSGGPDIEFAVPRDMTDTACIQVNAHAGDNTCEIVSTTIGNGSTDILMEPSKFCIGERILSFRTLLKRFNPLYPLTANWNATPTTNFILYPFANEINSGVAAGYSVNTNMIPSILTNVMSCYALARGGVRYKYVLSTSSDEICLSARSVLLYNGGSLSSTTNLSFHADITAVSTNNSGLGNGSNTTVAYSKISGGLEVEYPAYNRSFAYPVADVLNNVNSTQLSYTTLGVAPRTVSQVKFSVAPTTFTILQGAGDDFSCGLFCATPCYQTWASVPY